MRTCSQCRQEKSEDCFYRRADRPWLFLAICKPCRKSLRKEYESNSIRHRDYQTQDRDLKRALYRGVCAWCFHKRYRKQEVAWMAVGGRIALYHPVCAEEKANLKEVVIEEAVVQ